jgi:cytoskeletal protein CcmA (bactofilin family)
MAVGRISGPLLKENLIRNGINLAFETDLLYLDVNNQRIGIKNATPQHELDVVGTTRTINLITDTEADIADINIIGSTISTNQQYLNLGTFGNIVYQNKAVIDSIDIEGNTISTNNSNANLELGANGTGSVNVLSDMNVTGNIHATGNITADGSITIGDSDTDNIVVNAEIASDVIPDATNTYSLGSDPTQPDGKQWSNIWVDNVITSTITTTDLVVDDIDMTLRQGNIFYVAENGDDAHTGTHPQDPYASIKYALSQASSGDTIHIYPGVYTEEFPLTVPVGVTVKGQSLRAVTIKPTTATRYNDAFLLNGESTVEDVMVTGFYSGGNYFDVTARGAGTATVNVGTAPFAHAYVSGGTVTFEGPIEYPSNPATTYVTTASSAGSVTINVGTGPKVHTYVSGGVIKLSDSTIANVTGATYNESTGALVLTHDSESQDYADIGIGETITLEGLIFDCDDETANITGATYNHTTGELVFTHDGASNIGSVGAKAFLSNLTFSCNSDTRVFPDNGYAFRFATDFEVTTRSPYIRNITVITAGSSVAAGTNSADDPRGFNDSDAGKGAYIDGAYATTDSREASMLFHSATFICPGVDAITCTNGVRVEWLNSFTYFANRSFYAYNSNDGKSGQGETHVRLDGVSGTFTVGNTLTLTSTDSSTVLTGTISNINSDGDVLSFYGKWDDLDDFDWTPSSITDGTATATSILNVDKRDFGAEIRMIGSASVYGNYGLVGDGDGVIIYAIGQNLAYIGNGKEVTNDPETVNQLNEVVETNGAKIRYNSVDHKGDFRVGDLFYVNQDDGTVSFVASALNIDLTTGATFVTDGETTFVNGQKIETGNWRISGNTIETLLGDANFDSQSGEINLLDNVSITGDLDVTGDVTIGGNITIGDSTTDSINFVAGINSDLIPDDSSIYSLGDENHVWSNLFVDKVKVDDIEIDTNYITTTVSNSDLELRASGTGEVLVPSNDVQIDNNLTVNGTTTLSDTVVDGTITHTGDYTQTGDTTVTGNVTVTQDLDVSGAAQFEEILVDDNYITTTTSNADLELRASGTGYIRVPENDVSFSQDLTVGETIDARNITASGTVSVNDYNISDIHIDDNYIETTVSNADLELRANGTGRIYIPNNDVQIDNDLTVNGNVVVGNDLTISGDFTADDITLTGTATANEFTTGDIRIYQNVIETSNSNSDLELRTSGTGSINIEQFSIDENELSSIGDMILTPGSELLDINSTGALKVPLGDTSQRPGSPVAGQIRYNTDLVRFEGYNGSNWINLKGVEDLDGNTKVTAELYEGANDDTIRFIVKGTTIVDVDSNRLNAPRITVDDIRIDGNVISTITSDTDLEFTANGTGSVVFDNFAIKDNVITNTVSNSVTQFENTGNGYVKFAGTYGFVVPVGANTERPPTAFRETGMMRFNTDASRLEIFDGSIWTGVAGSSGGINAQEAEYLAVETVLMLG